MTVQMYTAIVTPKVLAAMDGAQWRYYLKARRRIQSVTTAGLASPRSCYHERHATQEDIVGTSVLGESG